MLEVTNVAQSQKTAQNTRMDTMNSMGAFSKFVQYSPAYLVGVEQNSPVRAVSTSVAAVETATARSNSAIAMTLAAPKVRDVVSGVAGLAVAANQTSTGINAITRGRAIGDAPAISSHRTQRGSSVNHVRPVIVLTEMRADRLRVGGFGSLQLPPRCDMGPNARWRG